MRFLATRRVVFLVLFSFVVAFSCVANSSAVGSVGLSVQICFFGAKSFEQMKKKAMQSPDSLRGL